MKTRFTKWIVRLALLLLIIGLIGFSSASFINRHIHSQNDAKIQTSITEIPTTEPPPIAVVFGAGIRTNGDLSPVLYDRVLTAVELYRANRVKKILMSGDNRFENYDEPTAMKNAAIKLGVPESDIVLDYAGRRTYDTCRRAKEIFEIQRAILVTQEFHQARALYLCNNLGVDSIGITANRRQYEGADYWSLREFFSITSAWFEINILSFAPVGGEKEPITQ